MKYYFFRSLTMLFVSIFFLSSLSCSDDDEEDYKGDHLFSIENTEVLLFKDRMDAMYYSSIINYMFFKDGQIYIYYYEMEEGIIKWYVGKVHNYPKDAIKYLESGKERRIHLSGEFRKSNTKYSDVPEDTSIEFYVTDIIPLK